MELFDNICATNGALRDRRGLRCLRRRDRPDGLHRLDRDWCLEIHTANDHRGAKGKQDPEGVHFEYRDVRHHKRDQCAQIAGGASPLHAAEAVGGRDTSIGTNTTSRRNGTRLCPEALYSRGTNRPLRARASVFGWREAARKRRIARDISTQSTGGHPYMAGSLPPASEKPSALVAKHFAGADDGDEREMRPRNGEAATRL
jgi:hypothetical protein